MADLQKTVEILFTGKSDIEKSIGRIENQINGLSRSAEKFADPFANVAEGVLKTEAALAALAAGGAALAISKFASFEDAMLKVKGVIGASAEDYDRLTALTKKLGEETRYTAVEAAGGLEFLALAGQTVDEAIGSLPTVLNLAQASALGLADSADILTNIMAGYGIAVEDVAQTSDILTATFTGSNTSLSQLGEAFKFVGPVAKSLGVSIEETAAVLGVLGNAGYQAEMGGTALRNILLALVAPMGNTGKLMKELGVDTTELGIDFASSSNALASLGVSIKNADGNMRPLNEIIGDLKTGIERLPDSTDRTATLMEIFGKRGGPQMAALLEQGTGAVDDLINKIVQAGGITTKIAAEMESGIGGSLRKLNSAFEAATLGLGESLSEGAGPAVDGLADIFRALSVAINNGAFDPLFDAFSSFGADIDSFFSTVAKNIPETLQGVDYSSFIRSLSSLSDALKDLFSGVDLDTPEGLHEAIQGLIDIISGFVNATAGFVDAFQPFFNAISQALVHLGEMDEQGQKTLGEIGALAEGISLFGAKVAAAFVVIGQSAETMGAAWDIVDGAMRTWWNGLEITIGAIAQGVIGLLAEIVGAYNEFANNLGLDGFPNLEKNLNELSNELFAGIGQDAIDANKGLNIMTDGMAALAFHALNSSDDVAKFGDTVKKTASDLPVIETEVTVTGTESYVAKLAQAIEKADLLPEKKETLSLVKSDGSIVTISKEIEKTIPKEITSKVKLESDEVQIERIKGQFETIQELAKFSMEIETARIKADAAQVEATFASISETMQSSGSVVSSLIGEYSKAWGSTKADIGWWIDEELDLRKEAVRLQAEMVDAQRKYMEARTQSMSKGESLISVTATGLEPELEAFMWKIIERVQIRVAEEQREFLLGI